MMLLIFLLALLPACLSLWQLYCFDRRMHRHRNSRLRQYRRSSPTPLPPEALPGIRRRKTNIPEYRYVDGVGYLIGDLSCEFNAKSPYVRCAVNPIGPCKGCHAYQAKDLEVTCNPKAKPS